MLHKDQFATNIGFMLIAEILKKKLKNDEPAMNIAARVSKIGRAGFDRY
jgi:hypothetical protein